MICVRHNLDLGSALFCLRCEEEKAREKVIIDDLVQAFRDAVPAGNGWREVTLTDDQHARILAFLRHESDALKPSQLAAPNVGIQEK